MNSKQTHTSCMNKVVYALNTLMLNLLNYLTLNIVFVNFVDISLSTCPLNTKTLSLQ